MNIPCRVCWGDDVVPGAASESAGESYDESSTGTAEVEAAEDMTGLVNDGCVKLGEAVVAVASVVIDMVVDIDGAVGAAGCVVDAVELATGVCTGGCDCCVETDEPTPAAAAAEYFTGSGRVCALLSFRPAFNILAIGFCSKFGGGGGFAAIEWIERYIYPWYLVKPTF